MNDTTPSAEASLGNPGAAWKLVAMDHFTPDGSADLLFQNGTSLGLWELNGTSVVSMMSLPSAAAGVVLQNRDGVSDGSNASDGSNGIMHMSAPDVARVGAASLSQNLLANSDPRLTQQPLFNAG